MAIYVVKALGNVEEYIKVKADFSDIREPCIKSEVQFLNYDKLESEVTDLGGMEFPDLLVEDGIYIMSDRFVSIVKKEIEDYVFLKPLEITCELLGKCEKYWIVVPPRIDCLNLDDSIIEQDWNFEHGIIPVLRCEKKVIDETLIGRFKMFKIAGISDNCIYIDAVLCDKIQKENLEGVMLIKCEEE